MSPFEHKFPLHRFLFSFSTCDQNIIIPELEPVKDHVFIFGPCVQASLLFVKRIIEKNSNIRIFWITNDGDLDDCQLADDIFSYQHIHLFSFDTIEQVAPLCAALSINLHVDVIYFCKQTTQLNEFIDELLKHFVLLHYVKNEYEAHANVTAQILNNLKDENPWYCLNYAAGVFNKKPLVLLGAGRSLNDILDHLKTEESSLNIMAAGSAMAILHDREIKHDMGVMVCPNIDSYKRLHGKIHPKVMFTAPRCRSELFLDFKGIKVVLPMLSHSGFRTLAGYFEPCPILTNLPNVASTSISLALSIAIHLGFDPIILGGVDLSYSGGKYAQNIDSAWEEERFAPEVKALGLIVAQAKVAVYTLSSSKIPGVKPLSLEMFKAMHKEKIDKNIFDKAFATYKLPLDEYLKEIEQSYKRCKEKWLWPLREVHLEEELSFQEFLKFSKESLVPYEALI